MVFFTCFHCGESVKKPSVSKHYLTKCRNKDPFLTCVDCLKDFRGSEYEAHTKCLTEEERYSGKGFVPKSQKKGERKQQAWQECIQTVLKKPTLKQDERNLIKTISKYENVPRKKAKFVNFLTNAFRNCTNKNDLIDRVWVEMESVFKESFGSIQEEQPKPKEDKEGKKKINGHENGEIKELLADENGMKKEKKRKRKAEENKAVPTSDSEKANEKSKKKKAKHSEENVAAVEGNVEVLLSDEQQEKKSRKRKAGEKDELEQNGSVADEAESGKKKKKKRHDKTDDQTISRTTERNTEHDIEQNDEKVAQKKKKKKKTKNENENINPNSNVAETTRVAECGGKSAKKTMMSDNKENCAGKGQGAGNVETPVPTKNKSESEIKQETFDWKATILQVLNQEGKNKKIPLQKLQKKVLKLHCKILNCENSTKKEKKFLKKLKEMSQVEVDEDFVVLKS